MGNNAVAITKGKDVKQRTCEALDLLGGIEKFVGKGDRVLIKPNLVDGAPFVTGEIVQLETIEAITTEALKAGASEVIVGETATSRKPTESWKAYEQTSHKIGAKFLDLLEQPYEAVHVKDPVFFGSVNLPKLLLDSDVLIDVPTLKTHCQVGITGAFKNYYGFLSRIDKRLYHQMYKVEEVILDLYQARKADVVVVDGTYTTFHLGPRPLEDFVETSRLDTTLASVDPVATDAISAKILGIDPKTLRYLKWGEERGFGERDLDKIEVAGVPLEKAIYGKGVNMVQFINNRTKNLEVLDCGACTGCLGLPISVSRRARERALERKTFIIMGPGADARKLEIDKESSVVLCGNCAIPTFYNELKGQYLPGCPPLPEDLVKTVEDLQARACD